MYTENQIEELIFTYLSGKATPEEFAALTAWAGESPEHLRRYQLIRNIWEVAGPAFDPDDIKQEQAHQAVMKKLLLKRSPQSFFVYWQRVAAVLLLPLILLSAYLWIERADKEAPISYQEVFAPYGTHSKVNLPDGSVAWLNAGSSLKFPTVFKEGERSVLLDGEAYFEVESDTRNPFMVNTEVLTIKATGTAFNVEAYTQDTIASVTMVKGKIDVTIGNARPFALKPGERMRYDTKQALCQVDNTDPYKWYAWKDGMLVFRDDPLDYVFKRIGQTFNVDIAIKDADIARHLYRATFEDESLDEILRLLKLTAPIQYKKFERGKSHADQYDKQRIEVYRNSL